MIQTTKSLTLTIWEYIYRTSPDYLINEISSYAVTRSQMSKRPPPRSPSETTNDSRIAIWNSWGDTVTLPISTEMQRRHSAMSWCSYTNDDCETHEEDMVGARYWPKDPKKRKQSKDDNGKKKTEFRPTLSNEKSPTILPDIPFLSAYSPRPSGCRKASSIHYLWSRRPLNPCTVNHISGLVRQYGCRYLLAHYTQR